MKTRMFLTAGLLLIANITYSQFTKVTTGDFVNHVSWNTACLAGDYDNDGLDDLLVTDELNYPVIFKNQGNGVFTEVTDAGIYKERGTTGIWADFNNDGYLDAYIAFGEFARAHFYLNNRNGKFTEFKAGNIVTESGDIAGNAVCGDLNNDGLVDLYITNTSGYPPGNPNRLYLNNGDTTFTNIYGDPAVTQPGNNYMENAGIADIDGDGDPDIFVTNWSGKLNYLYKNNGNGTFTAVTGAPPVNDAAYHYTSSFGDYNNDGFPDLFVGCDNGNRNHLYRNNGDGTFTDETSSVIYQDYSPDGFSRPPNSSSWVDYDNDGFLDLYVARSFHEQNGATNLLYHNLGDGTFEKITMLNIASDQEESHGHAWADFNRDGFMDLAVVNYNQANSLYLNNGNSNSWINLHLKGVVSNSFAIGAKVYLYAGGKPQNTEITSQTGRQSQNGMDAHFGLGNTAIIDSVIIHWPSGIMTRYNDVRGKRFATVTEAINGNIDACRHSTMIYQATSPATQYSWSVTGGEILSGQNTAAVQIRWTGNSAGQVGLVTNKGTYELEVNIIPVAVPLLSGPQAVCTTDTSLCFIAGNLLHMTCYWTVDGGTILSGQDSDTITVRWGSPGTGRITLFATSEAERCAVPAEQAVVISPNPEAAITISGKILVAGPGSSYQWYFNDLPVPDSLGGKEREITFMEVGYYRVRVTNSTGCSALSPAYLLNAVEPPPYVADNGIRVYPNPSRDGVTVELTSGTAGPAELRVSDVFSRVISRCSFNSIANGIYLSLPADPGIYFLTIIIGERVYSRKIIRE
ncbi:MAG: FG-GAP-like repeat-containing protein [Bacteroidota bacterium]